jgi:hypothetical protein
MRLFRTPQPEFLRAGPPFPSFTSWFNDHPDRNNLQQSGNAQIAYREKLLGHLKSHLGGVAMCEGAMADDILADVFSNQDNFGLNCSSKPGKPVTFADKTLSHLEFRDCDSLTLERCQVTRLVIGPEGHRKVRLVHSHIETIAFVGVTRELDVVGGGIYNFEFLNRDIAGPVSFQRVALPTSLSQVQPLRTLRAQLIAVHNMEPAGLVRAAELRIVRKKQDWPIKFVSAAYDLLSAYGTSAWRPLAWAGGSLLFNLLLLIGPQTTQLVGQAVGWQMSLQGDDLLPATYRAFLLTMSQVINPFGIFGRGPLVVATEPITAVASTLLGLVATAAIALFVLAIRRRIKLES